MADVQQNFVLKKNIPGSVIFRLSPVTGENISKVFTLTTRQSMINLPENWALAMFVDNGAYSLLKKGYVVFENFDTLLQLAKDKGYYFDSEFEKFIPATGKEDEKILATLKSGATGAIKDVITKYGKSRVTKVAQSNLDKLTHAVITTLEKPDYLGLALTVIED